MKEYFGLFLSEYEDRAWSTAIYSGRSHNIVYPALALAGEAGEIANKVKKLWRDRGIKSGENLNANDRLALIDELGDALWYISALAREIGSSLDEVAALNLEKLEDRKQRGVLGGSGDNR